MKIRPFALAMTWLFVTGAAFAEEPFRTQVQITGKESGPYKVGATVNPKKRPYRMDPSRNITNDDLVRVMDALHPFEDPLIRDQINQGNYERLEQLDRAASAGAHPHTTAPIQDTVQELDPDVIETAGYEEDENYRNLDASISRARSDMQDALDRMSAAKDEQARQQAMRDYDGARQRLQQATSAAP